MTLQQLHYFDMIVRYGSISKAAKALFIAQPSVSTAIRQLEDELGFPLFSRNKKGIVLTAQGAAVLDHTREIFQKIQEIEEMRIHFPQQEVHHVCTDALYSTMIMINVLNALEKHEKKLLLQIDQKKSETIILERILSGEAFGGLYGAESIFGKSIYSGLKNPNLKIVPIMYDELVFCVAKSHPLSVYESAPLAELLKYRMVFASSEDDPHQQIRNIWFAQRGYNNQSIYVSDYSALERLICSGERPLMSHVCRSYAKQQGIEYFQKFSLIRASDYPLSFPIYWACRTIDADGPVNKLICQSLKEYAELLG